MRVLKGTLTFVLGIIMGIVLFVGAIAGTIYAVATSFTIGDITQKVGLTGDKAIFDEGSDITNKTIWEVGQDLIGDVQNIGNMTLNELAEKYGLSKKVGGLGEISGIDISPLFDIPINQLKDNLGVIVDNITLQDIGEFAGMDFSSYGLPVLDENLHNPVTVALDSILKSIDGDNISLRLIEDNFGITLGDNAIFNQIKDAPLSSFGDIINDLEVGAVIDADCDLFVKRGDNTLYVKSERYEVVPSDEFNTIKDGATTYVYGQSEDGLLKRELRFVAKTTKDADGNSVPLLDENGNPVYRVDNSCYGEEVDTEKTFYRFYEYEVYNPEMPVVGALYLRAYGNHMVESEGTFVPVEDGYVALANLASDETGGIISFTGNTVNLTSVYTNLITPETWTLAENYGINTEYELTKDSRLESGFDGYFRVKAGTSDVAIQAIAYTTVSGLNNATDALMSLKLCDLIEVDDESSQILKTLKDKPLNKLSDSIDDLLLGDVVEITFSLYKESDNGDYVYVTGENGSYYTLYNPQDHEGYQRYTKVVTGETELPDYVVATETDLADSSITKYYWNGTSMVAGTSDGQQLYVKGNASSKILQRLASLSIGNFSTAFDALILGDVIDVDMDLYEELPSTFDFSSVSPFDEFYVFDGTKYVPTDTPETYIAANKAVYALVEESESSAILKKLALVKVDALSEEMNNLIDTMRLDEVMDINTAHYEPTLDGSYVYVKAGGYFTLYNPAIHTDSQRYTKVVTGDDAKPDYLKATEADLADSTIIKYYWDGAQMVAGTPDGQQLYVKGNASNKILQRLARVEINDFSSAIDGLALSDVIDIDADEYRVAPQTEVNADVTGETIFYVYDNGLFLEADADKRADTSIAKYAVASLGTSHVVMKKMAYLPVTELGNRMNDVVSDLYLKDLVDIYEFDVIKDDDVANRGTEGVYFVPYDEDYTEYDEDGAHRFSFVRDPNGKYYLRNTMYFALTDAQADAFKLSGTDSTISFDYVQLTADNIAELKPLIIAGNGYFKEASDTEFHYNPALCSYIVNNGNTSNYPNVYVRKSGTKYTLPKYDNSTGMLYVKMLGVPVPYDSTSRVHADLEKFILVSEEGYAPVEDNVNDTRTKFYLGKDGLFRETTDNIYTGISFIQNSVKHQDGSTKYYYYAPVDSEYNALVKYAEEHGTPKPPTFSKQLATTVYSQTDKALATKAFYDKKIIDISLVPEGASDVVYVKEEIGHVLEIKGGNAEVQSYLDLMHKDTRKVVYVQQQSAAALKAFSVHNVKVSSLDSELKNFTVGDMMDIAPDSLFDDDEIKNSTIDDLGNAFQEKLQNMTIQNILDWGNITTLSPDVLTIIGDATLEDFFDSLSYTPENGIHVDIVTLYKNIYKTNNSGTV